MNRTNEARGLLPNPIAWIRLGLIAGAGFASGCANLPPLPPEPPPSPEPTIRLTQPLDYEVGRVLSVNERLRFVVLDYSLNPLPAVGNRLVLTRGDDFVGELKVTGPIRNTTLVADIISGEPQPGDQARPDRR